MSREAICHNINLLAIPNLVRTPPASHLHPPPPPQPAAATPQAGPPQPTTRAARDKENRVKGGKDSRQVRIQSTESLHTCEEWGDLPFMYL